MLLKLQLPPSDDINFCLMCNMLRKLSKTDEHTSEKVR